MSMSEKEINPILFSLKWIVFDLNVVILLNQNLFELTSKMISSQYYQSINMSSILRHIQRSMIYYSIR